MKIKIDEIPEDGLSLDLSEEGSSLMEIAGPLEYAIVGTVEGHMELLKVGDQLLTIDGSLKAKVTSQCSRCLKPLEEEHSIAFKESLLLSADGAGGGEGKERELSMRDMDYTVMEAPELDTAEVFVGQIVDVVSDRQLCKDSCKGLCHSCGQDLNEGTCGCQGPDNIDIRFAKLKGLKIK